MQFYVSTKKLFYVLAFQGFFYLTESINAEA